MKNKILAATNDSNSKKILIGLALGMSMRGSFFLVFGYSIYSVLLPRISTIGTNETWMPSDHPATEKQSSIHRVHHKTSLSFVLS